MTSFTLPAFTSSTFPIILLLMLVLLGSNVQASIVINEIMYDPEGSEDKHEWIEIYNFGNDSVDLTNWRFFEGGTKHKLKFIKGSSILESNNYAIIANDAETFLNDSPLFNGNLFDSSFSLSKEEYLALNNSSGETVDEVFYNSNWGTNKEGYSLELIDAGLDNNNGSNWGTSYVKNGTPGEINSVTVLGLPCDRSVSITLDKLVINATEKVYFTLLTQGDNFTIEYWIEDLSQKIVKSKTITSTTTQKSWTPTRKGEPFLIFARLVSTDCHDANNDDDNAKVLFYVSSYQESIANINFTNLFINEFLPDPIGSDDNNEFIELYNPTEHMFDLSGFYFEDEAKNKLFISDSNTNSPIITPFGYLTVYRSGSSFSLNNNGFETISFFDPEGGLINQTSYEHSSEGMSWSRIKGQWYESKPTPNEENYFEENCDWKLSIKLENSIFKENSNLTFGLVAERLFGFTQNITVKGKIEDLFGNIIKDYSPWTNHETATQVSKDYSPNLKEGAYQISFWFENLTCNDNNQADNKALTLIAINPKDKTANSSLAIQKLYLGNDNTVEWGDQFTAQVNIYKGKETKYSVELWAEKSGEKISKSTKLNIYEEYSNYTLTLPIQLIPNCDEKFSDGEATLVLEGLDLQAEQTFTIDGINEGTCEEISTQSSEQKTSSAKENPYQIADLPPSAVPKGVFRVKVQLMGDNSEHEYKIWSYLYRGSKCYSCSEQTLERESNMQEIKLKKNELKTVDFLIKVDDVEEGEYKLKVKLNKDSQKTNKELTGSIYIKKEEGTETGKATETDNSSLSRSEMDTAADLLANNKNNDESTSNILSAKREIVENKDNEGVIVYESSSDKAKRKSLYFLLISFVLIIVILILKKEK